MEKEKEEMKKVWVLGHKNPDTDSICAAIAYAALKNATEKDTVFVAKRAGQINEETRYVLEHFDVKEPELAEDARGTDQGLHIGGRKESAAIFPSNGHGK